MNFSQLFLVSPNAPAPAIHSMAQGARSGGIGQKKKSHNLIYGTERGSHVIP